MREYAYYVTCVDKGWQPLVKESIELMDAVPRAPGDSFELFQVKEKFGELRMYVAASGSNEYSDKIYALADKAVDTSRVTCEACGEPGELRGGGWLKTLCDKHAAERNK